MDEVTNDGTDVTVYSSSFLVSKGETWAAHIEKTDGVGSYAAGITLWASCKPSPSDSDDSDWVQMVAAHGWAGFPALAGTPDFTAVGAEKDLTDLGVSGALWYRFKFVRTAGAATVSIWVSKKDEK